MALSYGRMQDYPIRPLSKGMFTDLPANGIPSGGFNSIKNFRIKEGYIETRGGLHQYYNGSAPLSGSDLIQYDFTNLREKIQEVIYHWKTVAQSETLILTDNFLYESIDQTNLNHILFVSGELTIQNDFQTDNQLSLEIVTGETKDIRPNDYLRLFGETTIIGRLIGIIGNTYYFELDPSITWVAGTPIEIVHVFQVSEGFKIDHTVLGGYGTDEAGNELILCDQAGRGVYKYTNGSLSIYETDSSPLGDEDVDEQTLGSAKSCTFFDDRLWLGNITETNGNNYPQRIWWSDALNFKRFNPTGYFDLPYSQGELLAIKPLGPLLVLYFSDTVYIGQPTQISGRPYEFQQINTNDVGLVSQGALATYDDGHFWVGQDDIYYLSGSAALQRIGSPIKSQTVEKTAKLGFLDQIQAVSDPENENVAFLFPDVTSDETFADGLSTKIWRFFYKPQAWGFDEAPHVNGQPRAYFSSLSLARTVSRQETYQTWYDRDGSDGDPQIQTNDYTTTWPGNRSLNAIYKDDDTVPGTPVDQERWENFESYNDLNSFSISVPRMFIGTYYLDSTGYYVQNILYESKDAQYDSAGSVEYPIDYELISADYDFGHPDKDKFSRQVSFRTMEHVDFEFLPSFWVSDGRGRRNAITGEQSVWYQRTSPVRFYTDYNEGRTGFLVRGSIFKFKMQFERGTELYRISEFVIRTKIEGEQIDQ